MPFRVSSKELFDKHISIVWNYMIRFFCQPEKLVNLNLLNSVIPGEINLLLHNLFALHLRCPCRNHPYWFSILNVRQTNNISIGFCLYECFCKLQFHCTSFALHFMAHFYDT